MLWIELIFGTNKPGKWQHLGVIDGTKVLESREGVGCVATGVADFVSRYTHWEKRRIIVMSKRSAFDYFWHHINIKTPYDIRRRKGFSFLGWLLGGPGASQDSNGLDNVEFVVNATGWMEYTGFSPDTLYLVTISSNKVLAKQPNLIV